MRHTIASITLSLDALREHGGNVSKNEIVFYFGAFSGIGVQKFR
jgi:hypothetical protein